jgi:hypothetical protein
MESKYTKIEWGCMQKNGIKLIEPNAVRGQSYLDAADADLREMQSQTFRVQNSAAYKACYNSFYSILQKIGIKCEIDECTFEFFNLIEGFSNEQRELVCTLMKNNIEIEKEIKKPRPVEEEPVRDFVTTAKQVFDTFSQDKIRSVRKEIQLASKKKNK